MPPQTFGSMVVVFFFVTFTASEAQHSDIITNVAYHKGYSPSSIIRPSSFITARRSMPIRYAPLSPSTIRKSTLDASQPLPCCKDESGGSICRAMKSNDPRGFAQKCAKEPDFSLVVCCKSCDELGQNYRERATTFFSPSNNNTNCFDRMSPTYCSRFQSNSDSWSAKRWSCRSEHYRLGFRVCRSTCGFCSVDWLNAPEPAKCN
ncbi:unnamed protein product [Auanema sp. JU1783]|nr:unnamed protein product [Auanema sp. JU1783]